MSEEQNAYIMNPDSGDSKLMAVAGSGKTRCILYRMQYLIQTLQYDQDSVIMVTFSKNARQDFLAKARKLRIKSIDKTNCYTIDSLAWRSLKSTTDVSILSYSFMIMLQTSDGEQIKAPGSILSNLKHVFVDEAQDLNPTQNAILMYLKDKLCINVHMIGDPAQNIFQFRASSDKFLLNFNANTFFLSKNYRSSPHIVKFSSCLRTHAELVDAAKPVTKSVIKIVSVRDTDDFERMLVSLIGTYTRLKIPLEKCAILAPTRGKVRDTRGIPSYTGLCYVANLLFQSEIPFSQFYSDSNAKIKYKPVKGRINLLTYHGSKGLEWNNVIVIDANAYLITRANYTAEIYSSEQYLIYVACSRAIQNMIVVTKMGMASPWFKLIPAELYSTTGLPLRIFDSAKLEFTSRSSSPCAVTKIIAGLSENHLWEISEILRSCVSKLVTKLEDSWGEAIIEDESKKMLLGCAMENFFMTCSLRKSVLDTPLLTEARNISQESNVLLCSTPPIARWYQDNKELMCWDLYDKMKGGVDGGVQKFVLANFDRSIPFGGYTLVDKFYKYYADRNRERIMNVIDAYNRDPFSFHNVFNVTVINYAIGTHNYFFMEQIDHIRKIVCTADVNNVSEHTSKYCARFMQGRIKSLQRVVCAGDAQGVIDFIDVDDKICEIKCVKNVGLNHVLQVLSYALMMSDDENENQNLDYMIYNLYDGTKHTYTAIMSHDVRERLRALIFSCT